jgi:hypothetical protein
LKTVRETKREMRLGIIERQWRDRARHKVRYGIIEHKEVLGRPIRETEVHRIRQGHFLGCSGGDRATYKVGCTIID